jgi:hypothetical protein
MFTAPIAPRRLCRRAIISAGLTLTTACSAHAGAPIAIRIGAISAADANLARAVRETLATDLAKSDRLTVLGGSKAQAATYTLTGSCLFVDENVVINLRMVNESGNSVPGAAENIDGPRGEVFQLVHAVAEKFRARIGGGQSIARGQSPVGRGVRLASVGRIPVPAPTEPKMEPRGSETSGECDIPDNDGRDDRSRRYTSVIIDARGFNLERSMSPRIRRLDGSTVYDGGECTPDFAIEQGVVVYARRLSDARSQQRAGSNPLILPAIDRYNQPLSGDPLISDEDADYLVRCARRDGFFKKFNVIFLID